VKFDGLPHSVDRPIMGGWAESFSFSPRGSVESFLLSLRFRWICGKILSISCYFDGQIIILSC
jgi:hypothetical protein